MQDDFKPPINSRSTDDLLKIVGCPKKWNSKAVTLAKNELYNRKIDLHLIDEAKSIAKKEEMILAEKKANKRFDFFTLDPFSFFINWPEVFVFLFSWEFEKDGYLYKAKMQRKYRPIIIISILLIIILSSL